MQYVSTRGGTKPMRFTEAVMAGLAADGGLLIPEHFPDVRDRFDAWRSLSYPALAAEIFKLYADDVPAAVLERIAADAYATFDHDEVAPLIDLGDVGVLELFHGPTLAFKDFALQVLGRLFEHILAGTGNQVNILAATSGDTGSAAIHSVRGRDNVAVFVLFPKGRTSPLQELQMTTVLDANVHCLAIKGSFDDCQSILKSSFADAEFKARHRIGAMNSVNWARVMAQVVYYIFAYLHLPRARTSSGVVFAVPTGNFGNLFAGLVARRMGLPIDKLILATNENDILARFFNTGVYQRGEVCFTTSPAMDIQVASNLERFLYLQFDRDPERVRRFMADFAADGSARLDTPGGAVECPVDEGIIARRVSMAEVQSTIRSVYEKCGYVLDPHTAVGVTAAREAAARKAAAREASAREATARELAPDDWPICMATAHPAKFPDAVDEAIDKEVARHPRLDALRGRKTRCTVLPADGEAVRDYVRKHAL